MEIEPTRAEMGSGYAAHQLAKAFVTALTHQDAATRRRAERRITRWEAVRRGMASGKLNVGSPAPVADLPIWATPEVLRGGFATGRAQAEGELSPHEAAWADRVGVARDRRALFAYLLTEAGLAELWGLLASGRYRVKIPEDAALLTVAWLVHAGDTAGAVALVRVLAP